MEVLQADYLFWFDFFCFLKKKNIVKAICQFRRIFIFLAHNVLSLFIFIYTCFFNLLNVLTWHKTNVQIWSPFYVLYWGNGTRIKFIEKFKLVVCALPQTKWPHTHAASTKNCPLVCLCCSADTASQFNTSLWALVTCDGNLFLIFFGPWKTF